MYLALLILEVGASVLLQIPSLLHCFPRQTTTNTVCGVQLFNSIMTTMGTGAMSLGIFAAVPMLENLIFGKEKMKEIQANVQSAAQEFQSSTAPGLGGQLESLAGMKEGEDRSVAILVASFAAVDSCLLFCLSKRWL